MSEPLTEKELADFDDAVRIGAFISLRDSRRLIADLRAAKKALASAREALVEEAARRMRAEEVVDILKTGIRESGKLPEPDIEDWERWSSPEKDEWREKARVVASLKVAGGGQGPGTTSGDGVLQRDSLLPERPSPANPGLPTGYQQGNETADASQPESAKPAAHWNMEAVWKGTTVPVPQSQTANPAAPKKEEKCEACAGTGCDRRLPDECQGLAGPGTTKPCCISCRGTGKKQAGKGAVE